MIGIGHSRIARITSPVIFVKPHQLARPPSVISSPMISLTSPPPQKPLPSPRITSDLHVGVVRQLGEQVAQVGVRLEGQRVELLGPVQRDGGDAAVDREAEVLPVVGQRRRRPEPAHGVILSV